MLSYTEKHFKVTLFHRYLNVETDGKWTSIAEQEDYAAIGNINYPIHVGFFDIIEDKVYHSDDSLSDNEFNDDDDEFKLVGCFNHVGIESLQKSNHINFVSLLKEISYHQDDLLPSNKGKTSKDFNPTITHLSSKSALANSMEQLNISNDHVDTYTNDVDNVKAHLNWVENGAKHFLHTILSRIPIPSIISETRSPFSDYWRSCDKVTVKKLLEVMIGGQLPHSKVDSSDEGEVDIPQEFALKVAASAVYLFDIDKVPYQCFYCHNVELNDFERKHHIAICLIGELRCLFISKSWILDDHVDLYTACQSIQTSLEGMTFHSTI